MNAFLRAAAMLSIAAFASCNKCDDKVSIPETPNNGGWCGTPTPGVPCDPEVICTMEFASVTGTAMHGNGTAAALDSFVVTDMNGIPLPLVNGQKVYGYPSDGTDGRFTVINDAWLQGHQNTWMDVRAKGWKNGTLIFDQPYSIGADCCHVRKASGPDTITVL
jgi:hypothetical protein